LTSLHEVGLEPFNHPPLVICADTTSPGRRTAPCASAPSAAPRHRAGHAGRFSGADGPRARTPRTPGTPPRCRRRSARAPPACRPRHALPHAPISAQPEQDRRTVVPHAWPLSCRLVSTASIEGPRAVQAQAADHPKIVFAPSSSKSLHVCCRAADRSPCCLRWLRLVLLMRAWAVPRSCRVRRPNV
jgi:hypothetical protein